MDKFAVTRWTNCGTIQVPALPLSLPPGLTAPSPPTPPSPPSLPPPLRVPGHAWPQVIFDAMRGTLSCLCGALPELCPTIFNDGASLKPVCTDPRSQRACSFRPFLSRAPQLTPSCTLPHAEVVCAGFGCFSNDSIRAELVPGILEEYVCERAIAVVAPINHGSSTSSHHASPRGTSGTPPPRAFRIWSTGINGKARYDFTIS